MLFLKTRLFQLLPTPSSLSGDEPGPKAFYVRSYARWWKSQSAMLTILHKAQIDAHQDAMGALAVSKRRGDGLIYL